MDNKGKGSSTSTNVSLTCGDLCMLIVILVLYLVGNDKECGIPADHLLLSYIIIKCAFIPIRILLCICVLANSAIGVILNLVVNIITLVGIVAFYII